MISIARGKKVNTKPAHEVVRARPHEGFRCTSDTGPMMSEMVA